MKLTKIGTGQFTGSNGASVTVKLAQRTDGSLFQMISAVYGKTVLSPSAGTVTFKLTSGTTPLTIVYAHDVGGGWLDLFEVDGATQQKLRATIFDSSEPTVSIELEGK